MEHRFKNGNTRMEHRVSPNGTPEVVIHLMPIEGTVEELYQEVSAWVMTEKDVEHTILLNKHTDRPCLMIAFQSRGYDE